MGGADNRSSVMHYPFPLIHVDAQGRPDLSDAYRPGPGFSDSVSIRYAYTWFPTPEAEAAGLKAIADEAIRRGHRFITLERALQDPAYRSPDTYRGPGGLSWLDRWALTRGAPISWTTS